MTTRTSSARWLIFTVLCTFVFNAAAQKGADQINANGQLVLAAKFGNTARVASLLKEGAAVNSRDREGDTPLNMAAARGNADLAAVLLQAGADVNLANLSGVTPLMAASFAARPEIVQALLARGARTEPQDRVKKTATTYAAAQGCTPCLEALSRAGAPLEARLDGGLTLLMWAAGYGREDTVRFLLQRGVDPALRDERGKTAEDIARENGHTAVVQALRR